MKIIFILLFLVTACGKPTTKSVLNAHKADGLQNLSWDKSTFPIILKFHYDEFFTDPSIRQACDNAVQSWNSALGIEAIRIEYVNVASTQSYTALQEYLYDSDKVVITPNTWPDSESSSAIAVTAYLYNSNKRLLHGDIIFNPDYTVGSQSLPWEFDLESVLIHEVGHFLGLAHTKIEDDSTSVMNPSIGPGTIKRTPSALDVVTIRNLYKID